MSLQEYIPSSSITQASPQAVVLIIFGGFFLHIIYLIVRLSVFNLFLDFLDLSYRMGLNLGFTRRLYHRYHNLLNTNFTYYRQLSDEGKTKFLIRVYRFISSKTFTGRHGLKVTEEMKALVAASAVQLTYGLRYYDLPRFSKIYLYPEAFYSRLMGRHLKGGASPQGVLFLSWKDFIEGYRIGDDKYNLGLHEMAHALSLSLKGGEEFSHRFEHYMRTWWNAGVKEFNRMQKAESFLRSYGGTNKEEFFAVNVEHFFEAPEAFNKELPEIYAELVKALNQDPINQDNDYAVDYSVYKTRKTIPKQLSHTIPSSWYDTAWRVKRALPQELSRTKNAKESVDQELNYWPPMLTFFFMAMVPTWAIFLYQSIHTYAPDGTITAIWVAGAFAGMGLQYHKLIKTQAMEIWQYIIYNAVVVAPVFCALTLLINNYFPVESNIVEVREIVGYSVTDRGTMVFELQDNAFQDYTALRKLHYTILNRYDIGYPINNTRLSLNYDRGSLGFIKLKKRVIMDSKSNIIINGY